MANKPNNRITTIIEEIYEIDPSLIEFEADLSRIITALETNRPETVIDQEFVSNLRASLLSHKPAPARAAENAPVVSPFFWWFTRLTPVGISLILLIVLAPDIIKSPTENYHSNIPEPERTKIVPPMNDSDNTEMRMDTLIFEGTEEETANDTSIMSISAAASLEVAPPLAGNTLTITYLNMPEAGWVATYKDHGGELGEVLHSSFVAEGEYQDLLLTLTDELTYPELVTIVIYTGTNAEQFDPAAETVQIDPLTDAPMMVTVPVISQLELELVE